MNKIKSAIMMALTVGSLSCLPAYAINTPYDNPVDTSLETSRECGRDLYEGSKFRNVVPLSIASSDGQDNGVLLDENYRTSVVYGTGTRVTVTSATELDSIFVVWDSLNVPWVLEINGNQYTYGQFGFLHEYVKLPEKATSFDIIIPDSTANGARPGSIPGGAAIADIYAFDSPELPSWVQTWEPVTANADIMVVSAHSDDEEIFFGGLLPTYQAERGNRVQYVFLFNHWTYDSNSKVREHEKLCGIWTAGAKYYPLTGDFSDAYSESLEEAKNNTNFDLVTTYLTQCIRMTHPQVVVSHDIHGEYGHGQHMIAAAGVIAAVEAAGQPEYEPVSAELYGAWNTPKLYLHMHPENLLSLNFRIPLNAFGGKTAIEVARQAYLCHESQQYCWFTVDDYGPLGNHLYGLVASSLGADTENDIMSHITPYEIQEEQKRAEQESIQASIDESESIKESIKQSEEESKEQASREEESRKEATRETTAVPSTEQPSEDRLETESSQAVITNQATTAPVSPVPQKKTNTLLIGVIIAIGVIAASAVVIGTISYTNKRKRRKRRKSRKR